MKKVDCQHKCRPVLTEWDKAIPGFKCNHCGLPLSNEIMLCYFAGIVGSEARARLLTSVFYSTDDQIEQMEAAK